ncbi:zinc ribbon domain-containing protein [Thermocrinis minervae]|uniref:Uncharacterized protein n=1 Tax=Thermocrinis minervae TaxID=381751 RepID=A0A1M6RKV7_9AQUI|nr:zinc ribbon domain-containing protein [Thermocrinis minervae]SHK32977.1 hypothetical protein SAMN05444391_0688 [Thermocrinis minervae]
MDLLKSVELLFADQLVSFFVWMALLHILAQVFVDRRVAFWISSLATTYLWIKNFDLLTPTKAWAIIFLFFAFYFILKLTLHINLFLLLKGKKRCPECYSEVHLKAKVCPFCRYSFKNHQSVSQEV